MDFGFAVGQICIRNDQFQFCILQTVLHASQHFNESCHTLHISTLSFNAAICNGVRPSLFLALTWLGLILSNQATNSLRPEAAASCNGKSPLKIVTLQIFSLNILRYIHRAFLIHKFAPLAPISLTVSNWPLAQPQCAGLRPLRSCLLGSAPCASKRAVASAWPAKARFEDFIGKVAIFLPKVTA